MGLRLLGSCICGSIHFECRRAGTVMDTADRDMLPNKPLKLTAAGFGRSGGRVRRVAW